jgi:hypothetical protein
LRRCRQSILFAVAVVAAPCGANNGAVLAVVQKYCLACHNATVTSGDLNLEALSTANTAANTFDQNRDIWERIAAKLKTGQMPPAGVPRPPEPDLLAVTRWLDAEFARQDRSVKQEAGRVTARRLNRAEYSNTLRDLLGVDIQPAANFPVDESAFGFDNNADALNLSPALLGKYLHEAEIAVRTALFGPEPTQPSVVHYSFPVRINLSRGQASLPKDLSGYDQSGLSLVYAGHTMHRFPADGEYSFRLVLNGHRPNQSEPAHPALFIDGKMIHAFEVDATDLEGQIVETRAPVTAGEHLVSASYLKVFHGLPPDYHGPEPSTRPPVPLLSHNARGALSPEDIETLRKYGTKIKTDAIEKRLDNRFESVDIGGPFGGPAAGPTAGPTNRAAHASVESLRKIYVCGQPGAKGSITDACARAIVTDFASRAFRRPATPKEADSFLAFFSLAQKNGDGPEEGIATALEAILVSPRFLYRIEQDRPAAAGQNAAPVSDYELASRLSYFLWSSMPDAELLRLAGQRQLNHPATLAAQVRRMLKDGKSDALVENFAGQWLQFRNIDVVRPDVERFPDFDESLRRSMRRETQFFVANMVRQDAGVLDFLDANYTFVDERLARFYGIPGVTGPDFRKVDIGGTRRGGGILSQASILTLSSYSTRTSPVLRGKWILDNLLNAPPPPPPPGVPALDDTKAGKSASLRQEMEEHRRNAVCASCHSRMDPLGFGLENFNAIGQWREDDGKFPVDASGTLPGGGWFRGPAELKSLLKADRDAFVNGLAEKLLVYALGRGLERYDRPALAAITTRLAGADYRFSELVLGIVNSVPFRMRQAGESRFATARRATVRLATARVGETSK